MCRCQSIRDYEGVIEETELLITLIIIKSKTNLILYASFNYVRLSEELKFL